MGLVVIALKMRRTCIQVMIFAFFYLIAVGGMNHCGVVAAATSSPWPFPTPFGDAEALADPFRPPAVPIITFAPMQQKFLFDEQVAAGGPTRYWDGTPMPITVMARLNDTTTYQLLGAAVGVAGVDFAPQRGMPEVLPTTTNFYFAVPTELSTTTGLELALKLSFVTPMLPDDLNRISRPVVYVTLEAAYTCAGGGANCRVDAIALPSVVLYVDATAQNCVHLYSNETVTWKTGTTNNTSWTRIGRPSPQSVLGSCGDEFMMDWGHMYLATDQLTNASVSVQYPDMLRTDFAQHGTLPPTDGSTDPVPATMLPTIAAISHATTTIMKSSTATARRAEIVFAYDGIDIQYYFGVTIPPRWKLPTAGDGTAPKTASDLLEEAWLDRNFTISACEAHDWSLVQRLRNRFGLHYARIASLAYRQTLAAIELGYDPSRGNEPVAFLKEISSDGDVNTMDVIFPASPLLLEVCPEILKQLLIPVLRYANNETWVGFDDPFSPHQLGTYPISNLSSAGQEIMPLENTGNMFIMLLAYTQRTSGMDLFFEPFWNVLKRWGRFMVSTQLPVPPDQICTDDFAGPLPENTNLAAKGMIALRAFHDLCQMMDDGDDCEVYRNQSIQFANYWTVHATESDGTASYSKLAYNWSHSWSTKYNLLWQKVLQLHDEPFSDFKQICRREVNKYSLELNQFGFPMDLRHTYQKLDWMTWGSALSDDRDTFIALFDRVYRMANETTDRWPLTDLFDTTTAGIVYYFRARPVVGAVYAPMLLHDL